MCLSFKEPGHSEPEQWDRKHVHHPIYPPIDLPTDLLPTHLPIHVPTYLATSICLSNITDLCNSDPRIRRSGDDAPSRNRCGNNLKIARAVPVSSHELWHVVFGTKRGMTARTKIRTSRRNTYLTVTSLNELRTEKYEDEVRHLRAKKAWSPTKNSTT